MPVPAKLPPRYTAAFVALGLVFFLAKVMVGESQPSWAPAWIDDGAWGWAFASEVFGWVGGLLLGAAGLNELVLRPLRNEWIEQTGGIVKTQLEMAVDELSTVGVGCIALASPVLAPVDDFALRNLVFNLSTERDQEDRQGYAGPYAETLRATAHTVAEDDDKAELLIAGARRCAARLVTHADRGAAMLEKIAGYRPDAANRLAELAERLRHEAGDLHDEAHGRASARVIAGHNEVLFSVTVAATDALNEIFRADMRVFDPGAPTAVLAEPS